MDEFDYGNLVCCEECKYWKYSKKKKKCICMNTESEYAFQETDFGEFCDMGESRR